MCPDDRKLAPPRSETTYESGDRSGVRQDMIAKVERVLHRLDTVSLPEDMDLPGFRLHRLKGSLAAFWSVTINGNWRIIFRMKDGQARDVDLVDYH